METDFEKLSHVVDVAMQVKSELVSEWGNGEPHPLSIWGWRGEEVVAFARVESRGQSREQRVMLIGSAVAGMRKAEQVTEVSIVFDGFVGAPGTEGGDSLAIRFVEGDETVTEGIIILHYGSLGDNNAVMVTAPYVNTSRFLAPAGADLQFTREWDWDPARCEAPTGMEFEDWVPSRYDDPNYLLSDGGLRRCVDFDHPRKEDIPTSGGVGAAVMAALKVNEKATREEVETTLAALDVGVSWT